MPRSICIRRATRADLNAIVSIEQGCFGAAGDAFTRRQLDYLIRKAVGACYIACDDDRIVGYISLLTRQNARNLRIYSIAVDSAARGFGAGQALVAEAVAHARRKGFGLLTLEVRADNTPAITLYTKNGFTHDRLLPQYYHDGSDGVRMKKEVE